MNIIINGTVYNCESAKVEHKKETFAAGTFGLSRLPRPPVRVEAVFKFFKRNNREQRLREEKLILDYKGQQVLIGLNDFVINAFVDRVDFEDLVELVKVDPARRLPYVEDFGYTLLTLSAVEVFC